MTAAQLFRRVVVAPAIVVGTLLLVVFVPLWLLIAIVVSVRLPGRWRAVRILYVALVYLAGESLMLLTMFGLWLASGFGRRIRTPYFQEIHYGLARAFLDLMFDLCMKVLKLEILTEGPSALDLHGRPLIVCSRHAGPGDSFILIHALLSWYDREPRIVLKHTLAWDPMFDLLLTRVPARFVNPNPKAGENLEEKIAELATGLDDDDAFVIFPEGGNFTPGRRSKAIERLRSRGLEKMAERAEGMTNLLAPRPGGVTAALGAAPDADVVLVAHTGLDHMGTIAEVWRELPMDKRLTMKWWLVPRAEIPTGRDAQIDWLYAWWKRIDDWIDDNKPVDLVD